jgi:hypothetical protein
MPLSPWLAELQAAGCPAPNPPIYECLAGRDDPPPEAQPLWLGCAWDAARPQPRERGLGLVWRTDDDLCVLGVMADSDVFSTAVGRNDQPWEKGDTLEFFFRPAGGERYVETHVTPSLATLEFAIPDAAGLGVGKYKGMDLGCDLGLRVAAEPFADGTLVGWWGQMRIPLATLGISPAATGMVGTFCICRYNYNHAWGKDPECSASAPFPMLAFHQPKFWHELRLG